MGELETGDKRNSGIPFLPFKVPSWETYMQARKQSQRGHCTEGDGDGAGAASQGVPKAPDAARGKGIDSPPEPPERTSPSNSLILAL